jgi:hypothetical protein
MATCTRFGQESAVGAAFRSRRGMAPSLAVSPGAAPAQRNKRPLRVAMAIAVQCLALMVLMTGCGGGSTKGEIRSTGAPHGDFVMAPPSCHSGEHESFFGVLVASKLEKIDGHTGVRGGLKVLKNAVGQWEAYLENPNTCQGFSCQVLKVEAQQCKVFDIEVKNTSARKNGIRLREGHARLDCAFSQGGSLKADLVFTGCD